MGEYGTDVNFGCPHTSVMHRNAETAVAVLVLHGHPKKVVPTGLLLFLHDSSVGYVRPVSQYLSSDVEGDQQGHGANVW